MSLSSCHTRQVGVLVNVYFSLLRSKVWVFTLKLGSTEKEINVFPYNWKIKIYLIDYTVSRLFWK